MTNILLVEDDTLLREINTDVLISEGHTVTTAVDGEDAYNKLKNGTWHIVLMDVLIPKLSGFEVIDKLKKEGKVIPAVIFLTNMDTDEDKKRAGALGGDYVIKGNLTPPELIALVKKHLPIK